MNLRVLLSGFLLAAALGAHPMGNFSVNHYARLEAGGDGIRVQYVLDLAEIPSFELLQKWNLEATSPPADLERKAAEEARAWIRNLSFRVNGRGVEPHFETAALVMDKGAGGMPVMRITARLSMGIAAGDLEYEDRNYAGRAGWKEIVIAAGPGASITTASAGDRDRSQALTAYPADPTVAPPQELSAKLSWTAAKPTVAQKQPPVMVPAPVPAPPAGATSPAAPQASAPGTVVRGDFLSQLLHRGELPLPMILAGLAVAFGLGAMHALSPGHGKTIVAAYLVGSRGTFKHAMFLGGMVTFTHTVSVFLLGLGTLFLSQYVLPEKVFPILGAISGLSIVWIGAIMLYKRTRNLRAHAHDHTHDHSHGHDHDHHHHHHDHDHGHEHGHNHGEPGHSHVPEGDVTLGSLIALGASGGLVPCPSALVLLLSSVALGRVGLGLLLLVGFSLGLAVVLMGIGMLVLYAKNLIPDSQSASRHAAFRVIPVLSAAVIVCLGLLMTGVSLGVIRPSRFIG
jgi:ABC-type nickel/cobalt efflux system permease component RcnA